MADKKQLDDHLNKAEGYLMLGMFEDALHEPSFVHRSLLPT